MKARDVAVQGVLAGVALVAACFVWQREPARPSGEVVVEDARAETLERIRYEDEARFVELFRDARDRESIWVRLGSKLPKPSPASVDGGVITTTDAGSGTPAPVPPPRDLRGNDVAKQLFARFAPLRAQRELGALDAKKLGEIGLANSPRSLTLTLNGAPKVFRLAAPASGWGPPYLQRASDGDVFLLGPSLLPDLEAASTRLVDRRLHPFDVDGFDRVVLTTGATARAFAASGSPPAPVKLTPEDAPGAPDDFARNWHDRLWRLTPVEFLGRGETPPGLPATPAFHLAYFKGGKPVGELSLAKTPDSSWYARTESTPGWVDMGGGLELLAEDAAKLTAPRR